MSLKQPVFTVVIPVYNKERHVARAINSVLSQIYSDFELIVVCDPSSDGSNFVVERFTDPRIRIFYRDTLGPGGYAARNLGIENSRGTWIAFLDADDEWYPEHLNIASNLIEHGNFDVVSTSWVDVWPGVGIKPTKFHNKYKDKDQVEVSRKDYLDLAAIGLVPNHTNTTIIKKALLDKVGGFPISCKRGGDVATWLRVIWESGGLLISTRATAVYHREDSSVTRETAPEVEGNCVYLACKEKLSTAPTDEEAYSLMRFSNCHVTYGLVRRATTGTLKRADCKMHYFTANKIKHLFFIIYSSIPSALQKSIWHFYRTIR